MVLIVRPTESKVFIELSKPIFIDNERIVSGYDERILMTPLLISGAIEPIAPDETPDDDGDDLIGR